MRKRANNMNTLMINKRLEVILDRIKIMDKKLDDVKISSNTKDPIDKRIQTWLQR
jgi:hypothetical protein